MFTLLFTIFSTLATKLGDINWSMGKENEGDFSTLISNFSKLGILIVFD